LPNLAQPETTDIPVAELDDIAAIVDTCGGDTMAGGRDAATVCLVSHLTRPDS
jgi:hypothetical protein